MSRGGDYVRPKSYRGVNFCLPFEAARCVRNKIVGCLVQQEDWFRHVLVIAIPSRTASHRRICDRLPDVSSRSHTRARKQHLLDHRIGAREQHNGGTMKPSFLAVLRLKNQLERKSYRQVGW
jgi:hypothetical protein